MKRSLRSACSAPSPPHVPLSKRRVKRPPPPQHPALSVGDVVRIIATNLGSRDQLNLRLVCKNFAVAIGYPETAYGKNRRLWDKPGQIRLAFVGVQPYGIEPVEEKVDLSWGPRYQSSYSLFRTRTHAKFPDCYFAQSFDASTDTALLDVTAWEYGLNWTAEDSYHVLCRFERDRERGCPYPHLPLPPPPKGKKGWTTAEVKEMQPKLVLRPEESAYYHLAFSEDQPAARTSLPVHSWSPRRSMDQLHGPFGLSNAREQRDGEIVRRQKAPTVRSKTWTRAVDRRTPIYHYTHQTVIANWSIVHAELLEMMAYVRRHMDEVGNIPRISLFGEKARECLMRRGRGWQMLYKFN